VFLILKEHNAYAESGPPEKGRNKMKVKEKEKAIFGYYFKKKHS